MSTTLTSGVFYAMIVGHIGIAFGARALKRDAPLSWLLTASLAPDAVDYLVAASGLCSPAGLYSHSLPAIGVLACVLGFGAFLHTRNRGTAFLVAALVVAHLAADFITGHKLLWSGGPSIGLYLYQWTWADFLVELPFIVGGWWMLRETPGAPRWTSTRTLLAALIIAQATADTLVYFTPRAQKPTPCAVPASRAPAT